jgi:plastocyanin
MLRVSRHGFASLFTLRLVALVATLAVAPMLAASGTLSGVVVVDGRPQKDVVVWLESGGRAAAAAPKKVVLDQRQLQFRPHVLAVTVGTQVEMPNSDRVFHNVFSFHDGKKFDLGLYPVGTARTVTFDRPGLSRIFCNIHPNMAAYVLALESAFFAVTNDHGEFDIEGVPVGSHAYRAWRPGGDTSTGTIAVEPGRRVEIRWR